MPPTRRQDSSAAPAAAPPTPQAVASGSLDEQLQPFSKAPGHNNWRDYWLKIIPHDPPAGIDGTPVLILNATRGLHAELMAYRERHSGTAAALTHLPAFLGARDNRVHRCRRACRRRSRCTRTSTSDSSERGSISAFPWVRWKARWHSGAERARMIALTFGALMAVSLAALLIWFVLKDPLFILYATMFSSAGAVRGLSFGTGLRLAAGCPIAVPLDSFAWNVPVGLSGAVACLFTREIADLKHFSPRVYEIFGWFAVAFVIITAANVAKFVGFLPLVNVVGNIMFVVAADVHGDRVLSCLAARQSRGGLVPDRLGLLEGFTIAAALRFL